MQIHRCLKSCQSPEESIESFRQSARFDGNTKRILPGEVLAAFHELGVKPEQNIFVFDGQRCGITAVLEARGFVLGANFEISRFAAYIKISDLYACGFMWGWDTVAENWMEPAIREISTNWAMGCDDGRAAWKACSHLAWPDTCRTPPKEDLGRG